MAEKKMPYEMGFAEFVAAARPSGAVNRLSGLNRGLPVYSYSVHMNGAVEKDLPENARLFDFKDVMVQALTGKLGLDPKNFRDNLKVAELAAARSAWIDAVCVENARTRVWNGSDELSEAVSADYELLTKGMTHPFIQQELDKQRALTTGLKPVLDKASMVTGKVVEDLAPTEVSVGKVVSQSMDFTVQETTDGEIVTHENRRLDAMPKDGDVVTISYYRGNGQVVDSLENVRVDAPFIDKESGDLAITLWDRYGNGQVVLFNSVTGFDKFVKAHGLDNALVEQAIDVRVANPVVKAEKPVKVITSDVYVDEQLKCLALDYTEKGVPGQVLFGSAKVLEASAKEWGLGAEQIKVARGLEIEQKKVSDPEWYASFREAQGKAAAMGIPVAEMPSVNDKVYGGCVVTDSKVHVVQSIGKDVAVIHCTRDLNVRPSVGDKVVVKYQDGVGVVEGAKELGKVQEFGRS